MSRKAIKAINWAALAERVPESEKAAYIAFKSTSDQFMQRMMAYPENQPPIDWGYYKKNVTNTSLVDKFQKEYEALSVPYPADKYTAEIEAQKQEKAKEIEETIVLMNKEIQKLENTKNEIKAMLPFDVMTLEDYCILYPEGTWRKDKVSIWPHLPEAQESPETEEETTNKH